MHKATVIISFYNRINFLKLVLEGLKKQSFSNFEVIIADDGSNEYVTSELKIILNELPFPTVHLWQEDIGFRKNSILNKAISNSSSDYLIFIDGDCVPHPAFIYEHVINRLPNVCLAGRRVLLSKKISESLSKEKIKNGFLERNIFYFILESFLQKSFEVEKGFYFKSRFIRKIVNRKKRGLVGSNFSIFKESMLKINGFDERYIMPSVGEDSDVQFRLELAGIEIRSFVNTAIQYHLFHEQLKRPKENLALFEQTKRAKISYTPFGINKSA